MSRLPNLTLLTILLVAVGPTGLFAQEVDSLADWRSGTVAKPPILSPSVSHGLSLPPGNSMTLGPVDVSALLAEDEERLDKILRYGVRRDLGAAVEDGKWHAIPRVGSLWTLDVVAEEAVGLRLHFVDLDLPPGTSLYVYAPDDPTRTFVRAAASLDGEDFWSRTTYGERVRVEYFVPAAIEVDPDRRPFTIDALQHIYREPITFSGLAAGGPGCHNDVTCYPTYSIPIDSVGGIGFIVGDALFCTGQLLNNLEGDFAPYFLTAHHCINTQAVASTVEIYWHYETSTCDGTPPALSSVPQSGETTLLATGASSDYTLLMIEGALPPGLAWVGWTSAVIPPATGSYGIHHPLGTHKRISFGDTIAGAPAGFLRNDWSDGPTEPGSSGSALFADAGGLIGQLWGGPSSCGSVTTDDYGAFSSTYPNIASFLAGGSDDAFEDNDSCGAAYPLADGSYPDLVVKGYDEDWYALTIAPGETVDIALSFIDAHGDIDIRLHDGCGAIVDSSDSPDDDEFLSFTNLSTSFDFTLRVYLSDDQRAEYDLAISRSGVANDSCVNAIALPDGVYPFDTTGTTTDGFDEPSGCDYFGYTHLESDIWYCYTAPVTGWITVSLCGSSYDTKLAIYDGCGCPAPDSALYCNDDACGVQSEITFPAHSGESFTIRVGGYAGAQGTGTLAISSAPPDDCADAIEVTDGTTLFDTTLATTDGPDEPGLCDYSGFTNLDKDIWYRYTATCTGDLVVTLCGSSYDTKLAIYLGSCPTGASAIACNDDWCGLESELTLSAVAGTDYLIRIGGYVGHAGPGQLVINCQLENDDCFDAIAVTAGTTNGTLMGATQDGEASCGMSETSPDVWYTYTAAATGTVAINTCGTSDLGGTDLGIDTVLSVHTGCPGSMANELDCNDDWPYGSDPGACGSSNTGLERDAAVAVDLTAGETIWIRVSVYAGSPPGPFQLNIAPIVPGDDCFDSIVVGEGTYSGNLVGATIDGSTSCDFVGGPDVWYTYTAPCDGILNVSTCGTHDLGGVDTGTDTVLSLHSGCPGTAANELECNDDWFTGTVDTACVDEDSGLLRDSAVSLPVSVGEIITIRVSSYASTTPGPFVLNVDMQCVCLPVSGLTCESDFGGVTLLWTNQDTYDLLRIYRDGLEIDAVLGTTTGYVDVSVPAGTYTYTVRGECGGVLTDPTDCVVVHGCEGITGLNCTTGGPDIVLSWTLGDNYSAIRVARDSIEIAVLSGGTTSYTDSSATTGTHLYNVSGDCGALSSPSADCLVTLNCAPITALSCNGMGSDAILTWALGDTYSGIQVRRDGALLTTLGGTATSFTDVGVGAGTYVYSVEGDCAGLGAVSVDCTVTLGCAPVIGLTCNGMGSDAILTWALGDTYSGIQVRRDGALLTTLGGTATSFTDVGVGAGTYVYSVEGDCAGLGAVSVDCTATLGCAPVFGLTCNAMGSDAILTWSLGDSYSGIEVRRDGALVATLGGTSTSFADVGVGPGTFVYSVQGDCGVLTGASVDCTATLGCAPVIGLTCNGMGADVILTWSLGDTYSGIEVRRDGALLATLGGTATSFADVGVGAGTYVYSVEGDCAGLGAADVDCTVTLNCAPVMSLNCSALGSDAILTWTLGDLYTGIEVRRNGAILATLGGTETSFTDLSVGAGTFVYTVQGNCGGLFPVPVDCTLTLGCAPVTGLTCSAVGQDALLSWTLGDAYGSIQVRRDGALIATLGGAVTSFTDVGVGSGSHVYSVQGDCGGLLAAAVDCTVVFGCAPVTGLTCSSVGPDVFLTWTLGDTYSAIRVRRDGTLIATLGGAATNFDNVGVPAGTYLYAVEGDCGGLTADATDCTVVHTPVGPDVFRRGDCNDDGSVDISDAVSFLAFLFIPPPSVLACPDACDANDDGTLNIADAVFTLENLFSGGAPFPAPSPACGTDPTADSLDCPGAAFCP